MSDNGQSVLFYEDQYDAIEKSIASSGKSKKEIASILYPGRKIETAMSLFSRALSPENTDVHLSIEMIKTILQETRPDDFIFYLCDEFGFERPSQKNKESFERDVKTDVKKLLEGIGSIKKKLEALERMK